MNASSKRVLVVNDERHIARLAEVNLQRQGYSVDVAADRASAWTSLMESLPDMIVLDIDHEDGFRLLQELKADIRTRKVPVVMLSPRLNQADVFRGWGGGFPGSEWFGDNSDDGEEPQ